MGNIVIENAHAKINLALDILYKRDDGYHEIDMLMQEISLHDEIKLEIINGNDHILMEVEGLSVPADQSNLAVRAAVLMQKRCSIPCGFRISLRKNIPVAAGLGGGSSDAAAVLRGLNNICNLNLTSEKLENMAAEIGSDVPFFIRGGSARATGRGEKLDFFTIGNPDINIVLVNPGFPLSTAQIYECHKNDLVHIHPDIAAGENALISGDWEEFAYVAGNVLEQSAFSIRPELFDLKKKMQKFNPILALMTGSGPSIFSIFRDEHLAMQQAEYMSKENNLVFSVKIK